jgi:type VII secretion integral membrane protein EccD
MNVITDTGTRAVTVCRGTRRVDVRLPAEVPVAELMPGLLDLAETERPADRPAVSGAPRTWALAPVGRPPLDWGHSLADAGVDNGDVLILTEQTTSATGAAIYDVADLAAARTELAGPSFGLGHALAAWPGAAALAGLAASLLPFVGVEAHPWSLTVAALVLAAAVVMQQRRPQPTAAGRLIAHGVAVAAIGSAVAAVGGWLDGQAFAVIAGWCGGAAAVLGATVWWRTEERLVGAFATIFGLGVALAAGLDAATLSPTKIALATGTLAFVAIGALPRVAVTSGGMSGLDLLIRAGGSPDEAAVSTAVTRSDRILTGLLAGCAVVAGTSAVVLGAGSVSTLVVAGLLAVGLLIRAQSFTRPAHRVVVRTPALAAVALIPVVAGAPVEAVVVAAVALPLAAYAGLLMVWPEHVLARLRLAVGWLEVAVVGGLVPAVATAAGLFAWLADAV